MTGYLTSVPITLWFDVERRNKTICALYVLMSQLLWFDVERRNKTIIGASEAGTVLLWFDVERRNKTIPNSLVTTKSGCGLM